MVAGGRRGSPPLPRQRKALRVVQFTLMALAGISATIAIEGYSGRSSLLPVAFPPSGSIFLILLALSCLALALWMGVRTVRGPEPPTSAHIR